jgi:hypothetical protein
VTDLDLNADQTKVALWQHGWETFEHLDSPTPNFWLDRRNAMLQALTLSPNQPLRELISALERDHGFDTGDGLTVIRNLLATRAIKLVSDSFSPRGLTSQLVVVDAAGGPDAVRDVA